MSVMTLADFLMQRIEEDETAARDAGADAMTGHRWKHYPADAYEEMQSTTLAHCRRVLAECESKRRLVARGQRAEQAFAQTINPTTSGVSMTMLLVLSDLALPYADHPDYLPEWSRDVAHCQPGCSRTLSHDEAPEELPCDVAHTPKEPHAY